MKRGRDTETAEERRAKRQRAASYSDSEEESPQATVSNGSADREAVRQMGIRLYDAARLSQDKSQRMIALDFMKVPPKKLYPDYYEIIKQPIALDDIKQFLDKHTFTSIEMVKAQFDLCFKNARKYNMKDSQIWRDAKALQKVVNTEYKKIKGIDQDEDSDDDKKEKKKNIHRTMKNRLSKLIAMTDSSGRILSTEFMELPSKKIYGYYYKQIKKPICFNHISKRIKDKQYSTMEAFAAEVNLIFSNAMEFNAEDSQIYDDAGLLKEYFRQLSAADTPVAAALPDTKIKLKLPIAPPAPAPVKEQKPAKPAKEPKVETLPSTVTLRVPTKAAEPPSLPVAPATVTARPPSPKLPVAPNTVTKPKTAPVPAAPKTRPVQVQQVPVPIHAPPPPPRPAQPPIPYYHLPPMPHPPPPMPAPPPPPRQTPAPPPKPAQPAPQVVYKYATPDPPPEAKHPIAAAVVQTAPAVGGTAGRMWKLGAREGVRTWSVRLGRTEKTVRLAKIRFMDVDESDDSDSEDGHETVVRLNGKVIELPPESNSEEVNGDAANNAPIRWEKELVQGMNILEFGAKGGEVWKMYLDRP